jgi:hypothetical protein
VVSISTFSTLSKKLSPLKAALAGLCGFNFHELVILTP